MSSVELCIPKGYRILEKTQTVDLLQAYKILCTKKQKKYTEAQKQGERAILKKHVVRCPFCGGEDPAYIKDESDDAFKLISYNDVGVWADIQLSLLSDECSTLKIQMPSLSLKQHLCSKCFNRSFATSGEFKIRVGTEGGAVFVSRTINDVDEILSLIWANNIEFSALPLIEKIVFDFETGTTYLEVEDINKNRVAFKDITFIFGETECGIITDLIKKSKILKRTLKRYFQQMWPCPLPYANGEIEMEEWIYLTYFVGYGKNFYDNLPFDKYNHLPEYFASIVPKIRTPQMAFEALSKAEVPYCKSVKRLFASEPFLFFYIDECSIWYNLFGDVNRFIKCMNLPNKYYLLSDMRKYPGMVLFFKDFLSVRDGGELLRALEQNSASVCTYAIRYCALSDYEKDNFKRELSKKKYDLFDVASNVFMYTFVCNAPMSSLPENIPDCTVGGFSFRWLKCKKDYRHAGTVLENCLVGWRPEFNPVTAVYHKKKIVAAIEVEGKMVVQMRGYQNSAIKQDSPLGKAIDKWIEKYGLVYDEDDLPF